MRFVTDKVALREVSLRVLRFFPVNYHSTNVNTPIYPPYMLLLPQQTGDPRTIQKGEHWIEKSRIFGSRIQIQNK
jgi:hypothetical protein